MRKDSQESRLGNEWNRHDRAAMQSDDYSYIIAIAARTHVKFVITGRPGMTTPNKGAETDIDKSDAR
jgi:hypothetical protein